MQGRPVARVIVDLDVPHLDRTFDYQIPKHLAEEAAVGSLVRVKWGGRRINGWIVEISTGTDHKGELSPILRVLSLVPLFTPEMLVTYRYLATRFAVNLSQVLSLAIPVRRQKVEVALANDPGVALSGTARPLGDVADAPEWWTGHGLPRIVQQLVPHEEIASIAATLEHCVRSGVPAIITAPTFHLARDLHRQLEKEFPDASLGLTAAELPQVARYETHLRTLRGDYAAVIGTRSAIWAPFKTAALQVVWQDGSDHYRERRSPKLDVLDVAVARVRWENYGLLAASLDRSVKSQALVDAGWAQSVEPTPTQIRTQIPKVQVIDGENFEREGLSALSTLPNAAYRSIRTGLQSGPVLIQVMGAQNFYIMSCGNCGHEPNCHDCGRSVNAVPRANELKEIGCRNCGARNDLSLCAECGVPAQVREFGAEKIGRELGRAFPQTPVVVSSSASKIRRRVRPAPQIVVATSGAEPETKDGYQAVIVAEADRLGYSDQFGAQEEALRRWLNTFAMAAPGAAGILSGDVPTELAKAVVRWRPVHFAAEQLEERTEVGLYPARWVVEIGGSPRALAQVVARLENPDVPLVPPEPPVDVLGFAQSAEPDEDLDDESTSYAYLACLPKQAMSLMTNLKNIANSRSLRKQSPIRITVNPKQFSA